MIHNVALKRPVDPGATPVGFRILPHNQEAEQGLLGVLLIDNRAMEKIYGFSESTTFFVPAHQRIFDAISKMIDRGQTASPVTLKNYFEKDEDLKDVGGAAYLAELAAGVVSIINAEQYARTIYDLHLRRELILLGEDVVNESFDHKLDSGAAETIEMAEKRLYDLAETGASRGAL